MKSLEINQYSPKFDVPHSQQNRNYQVVTFSSGLTCLLINDPSSHLFSAAVAVQGGHSMDPIDIPGLAHLCEHLVVGVDNARLHSEVTSAGGTLMAYTSNSHTCFGFEISTYAELKDDKPKCFAIESSLKKFSKYFTLQKFDLDVVTREMLSVHDEHMGNTTQINKILWQGLKLLASESHPFSRFSTGNMQTFTKPTLRTLKSKVKDLYHQTYIPKNMSLVLKGPQSPNHLRKLAITYFGQLVYPDTAAHRFSVLSQNSIPSTVKVPKSRYIEPDVFNDLDFNILWIKTNFEPRLRLCFPLKFGTYCTPEPIQRQLCNILGSESPNSWCYYLKSMMQYLLNVVVSVEELTSSLSVLICDLEMTKKGMRNPLDVIGLLFFFIEERILRMSEGSLRLLLDNFGRIEDILFLRSTSLHSSLDEVSDYASRMAHFNNNNEDFIRGYKRWSFSDTSCREVFLALRKVFCRSRVKIEILDKSFTNLGSFQVKIDVKHQQKCRYYGFEYMKIDFNFGLNMSKSQSFEAMKQIETQLPLSDLSANEIGSYVKHRGFQTNSNSPVLEITENHLELWLQPMLNENQVYASINIQFPKLLLSKTNLVGIEMLAAVLGNSLRYKLYHLELFDCNWGLYPNVNGHASFQFTYRGGNDYFLNFLEIAFAGLRDLFKSVDSLTYEDLRRSRILLRQLFVNFKKSRGLEKMEIMTHQLLEGGYVPIDDRIEELEMTDLESLAQIAQKLSEDFAYSTVLLSGNTKGIDLSKLTTAFDPFKIPDVSSTSPKASMLSKVLAPGSHYVFTLEAIDDDPSSIVYYYIQMGSRRDNTLFSTCKLLQFFISSNSFNGLRTQRSLSYNILSGMKLFQSTFGLFICIPAVHKDCQMLIEQIEGFLEDLEAELSSYDSAAWQSLKSRFFSSLESVDEEEDIPSSLFASLQPLVSSSGFSSFGYNFKEHWNCFNQVLIGTHNFGGSSCEEPINKDLILGLSHDSICKLFKNKISIRSNHKSNLVITKPAGSISIEMRIGTLATMYASMLARSGLVFTVEEVASCLKKCSDRDQFSDFTKHLKSLVVNPSQLMKFHKFNLLHRLSKISLSKSESPKPSMRSSAGLKEYFTEVEDFRQRSLFLPFEKLENRNEKQMSLVCLEDILNCYPLELTP